MSEDLAWAAGFFDGEGCFSTAGKYPLIGVSSTDRCLVARFQTAVGAGNISGPTVRHGPDFKRRPQWHYRLYRINEAQLVARSFWPWLGETKRRRWLEVLENYFTQTPNSKMDRLDFPDVAAGDATRRESLAWAAGFFDGEGCFHIGKRNAIGARITHTEPDLLTKFQTATNLGKIYGPYSYKYADQWGDTDRWVWTIAGFERMQALLGVLWFQLEEPKRHKAMEIVNHYLRYYACGHEREDAPWHKHCPQCFKPGPKPGSKRHKSST